MGEQRHQVLEGGDVERRSRPCRSVGLRVPYRSMRKGGATLALVLAASLSGCGSSRQTPSESDNVTRPNNPNVRAGSQLATTITAWPLSPRPGSLARGTRVPNRGIGERAFINARRGFALADLPKGSADTYPVATTDGGRTWRIDGPLFYIPAAQAPAAVEFVGVAPPQTYFAFGGGGSVVDISTDGGKHWRSAFLGDMLAVVPSSNSPGTHLIAAVEGFHGSRIETHAYATDDGGRHWHLAG